MVYNCRFVHIRLADRTNENIPSRSKFVYTNDFLGTGAYDEIMRSTRLSYETFRSLHLPTRTQNFNMLLLLFLLVPVRFDEGNCA